MFCQKNALADFFKYIIGQVVFKLINKLAFYPTDLFSFGASNIGATLKLSIEGLLIFKISKGSARLVQALVLPTLLQLKSTSSDTFYAVWNCRSIQWGSSIFKSSVGQ